MYPSLFLSTLKWSVQLPAIAGSRDPGLFYRVIAAIAEGMAAQNSPQGHERTAAGAMAFDGINGILGAGGGEAAGRWKQGRDQELVCPDEGEKKISTAFLQKIFH